jgi:hypothetical protein
MCWQGHTQNCALRLHPTDLQGCFPWWAGDEVVAKKAQGKEINGKSNNLNNW